MAEKSVTISNSSNPEHYMAFGAGLIIGSLIGLNGIIVIGFISIGYYNRDIIFDLIQDASPKLKNANSSTRDNRSSWYQWGRDLIPLTKTAMNRQGRKKSE